MGNMVVSSVAENTADISLHFDQLWISLFNQYSWHKEASLARFERYTFVLVNRYGFIFCQSYGIRHAFPPVVQT